MSELKFGPVKGEENAIKLPQLITTGEIFREKSGRFVTLNAGAIEVADAGDTLLYGWAEIGEQTTIADQETSVILAANCNTVFRIPIITGDLTRAMFGKTCDLVRATVGGVENVQGADLTASGEDVVLIVGGDLDDTDNYVDVMFTPEKVTGLTGVA